MKKFLTALLILLVYFGVITIGPVVSGMGKVFASSIVTGGTLTFFGRQLPKNIGYQPTMTEPDRVGIVQAMAETLMNVDSEGKLVPELATSVDTDPAAKTITWHLRQGVKFHDGTPFNSKAAAWNFQQLKEAGTLQFGEQIVDMATPDDYTLVFKLKNLSYLFVQAFSFNAYMLSPTAIEKNGKEWAITHISGTGPFMLESFDQTSKAVVVKNPDYWRPGIPYLDSIVHIPSLDSAVNYAAMKSNEIQMMSGGDLNLQKKLVAEGRKKVLFTSNKCVEFLVPSTDDPNSPLSNPLVREAIEYAIDRKAITQGIWQDNADPMDQMSFKGAVGYDPSLGRPYDPEKAKQLLKQAGYPGGKGINISIYVPVPAPLVRLCTAVAGYLQQVGINTKVEPQTFPLHNTQQAHGWKNGYFYLRDPGRSDWASVFMTWFGPLPTYNTNASLKRSDAYNELANKVLTAADIDTYHDIVTRLMKKMHDESLVIAIDNQPSTWVVQSYGHYEADMSKRSTFDFGSLWMEKQ